MKKVVFGITNLCIGGAEKSLTYLCNKLSEKYEITIFTLYDNGKLKKELSSNINIVSLYNREFEKLNSISKKLISIKLLLMGNLIYNKYIKGKFDTEVAFLEGPVTRLFSFKNKNAKKIAWVHTDISLIFGSGIKLKFKKYINKKVYVKYQKIIFVSNSSLESFNKEYKMDVQKEVVPNYIDSESIVKKSKEPIDFSFSEKEINFLSVARLVEAKGLERLIKVHHHLISEGLIHKIYIIGDRSIKK